MDLTGLRIAFLNFLLVHQELSLEDKFMLNEVSEALTELDKQINKEKNDTP
jgi:hypothetical protein